MQGRGLVGQLLLHQTLACPAYRLVPAAAFLLPNGPARTHVDLQHQWVWQQAPGKHLVDAQHRFTGRQHDRPAEIARGFCVDAMGLSDANRQYLRLGQRDLRVVV